MANLTEVMWKVQRILSGPMGLVFSVRGDRYLIEFNESKSLVTIGFEERALPQQQDPDVFVHLSSPVMFELTPSAELYEWVVRRSANLLYGRIDVVDDPDTAGTLNVYVTHSLLGNTLDVDELRHALVAVHTTADTIISEGHPRFGGRTAR